MPGLRHTGRSGAGLCRQLPVDDALHLVSSAVDGGILVNVALGSAAGVSMRTSVRRRTRVSGAEDCQGSCWVRTMQRPGSCAMRGCGDLALAWMACMRARMHASPTHMHTRDTCQAAEIQPGFHGKLTCSDAPGVILRCSGLSPSRGMAGG
eukprot:364183-Chlamydomonas_euryale.AAC.18